MVGTWCTFTAVAWVQSLVGELDPTSLAWLRVGVGGGGGRTLNTTVGADLLYGTI